MSALRLGPVADEIADLLDLRPGDPRLLVGRLLQQVAADADCQARPSIQHVRELRLLCAQLDDEQRVAPGEIDESRVDELRRQILGRIGGRR